MTYTTRFAPSPTGRLHLGGARTALFNWLAARATGGEFILRIDDTDAERSKEEFVDEIKYGLEWLGLGWDREIRQSARSVHYASCLERLLEDGAAVRCDDNSIRLNLGDSPSLGSWHDRIAGDIRVSERDWEYVRTAVLARSDGTPLYNFTSACDDLDLGVGLVIRGADHISNTALQMVLMSRVSPDSPRPDFAHVGLIHGADGKKMAKRSGDESFFLGHYVDAGYCADAVVNCLLRLGWGPRVDDKSTAVLTRGDALRLFLDGGNLRSSPSKFDVAKLDAWDRKFKARANIAARVQ